MTQESLQAIRDRITARVHERFPNTKCFWSGEEDECGGSALTKKPELTQKEARQRAIAILNWVEYSKHRLVTELSDGSRYISSTPAAENKLFEGLKAEGRHTLILRQYVWNMDIPLKSHTKS